MESNIKKLREQWATKLHELLQKRKSIDIQIMGIQQMLRGSAVLTEDPIPSEYTLGPIPLPPGLEELRTLGLTDAIRLMLKERPGAAMTATGIRDCLKLYEYPLTQSNEMIAVHQAIKRLAKRGEIRRLNEEGKGRYQWVSNVELALALDDPENPLYKSGMRPFPKQTGDMTHAKRKLTKYVDDGKSKSGPNRSKWMR